MQKKVLSLVLCLAMMFSIMVVGAGAAFSDQDKIENKEAVDVCSALNIINGYPEGDFKPDGDVTRAHMCKMICVALNKGVEPNLGAGSSSFSDVKADDWFAPFVNYCVQKGIVAGFGDGSFKPTNNVTASQAAKMLLIALGYDAKNEGYLGANWYINVNADAGNAGLYQGLEDIDVTAALNRDNAAQMIFNLLTGTMVKYDNAGSTIVLPDGTTITNGAETTDVSNSDTKHYDETTGAEKDKVMQFCEKFFPNLKKTDADPDAYGRPANYQWTTDKDQEKVAYTDVQKLVLTVNKKMTATELEAALKEVGVTKTDGVTVNYNWTQHVDNAKTGKTVSGICSQLDPNYLKNGYTNEFYVDENNKLTTVVAIDPVFGELTITEKKDITTYTVDGMTGDVNAKDATKTTAFINGDVKDGDMVLAYKANDGLHISAVNTVSGALTAINTQDQIYTIGDKQYELANIAGVTAPVSVNKESADYYVDANGYLLGAVKSVATSADVVYVTSFYKVKDTWSNKVHMFQGVLPDGTVITGKTDKKQAENQAYTYKVEKDVYELTAATVNTDGIGATQLTSNVTVTPTTSLKANDTYFFAKNVKFVYVSGAQDKLTVTVKDGLQARTAGTNDYIVVAKDTDGNSVVTTVFVNAAAPNTASEDLIYLVDTTKDGSTIGKDNKPVDVYEAYVNGEKTTIQVENASLSQTGFYSFTVNNTSGAYELTWIDTPTGTANVNLVDGVYYITVSSTAVEDYVATDAKVVDTRKDGTVNSMAALRKNASSVNVNLHYNADKVVDVIYVK